MIIYTNQKSKRRKPTAKERQLKAEWESLLNTHSGKSSSSSKKDVQSYVQPKAYVRETKRYPSLSSTEPAACTKPIEQKRYTGGNIIGIGTLHKSNAIPIFSKEDAKDQAKMRR